MNQRVLFLRWSLVVSLTVVGIVIAGVLGWLGKLYSMDATKITVLITLVFAGASAWCGYLATRIDRVAQLRSLANPAFKSARLDDNPEEIIRRTKIDAQHGEYAGSLCLQLGLLGTVIGLTMTFLSAFTGFQAQNMEAVKQLIDQLAAGTATAFITTIVGLVCSLALGVQYHLLKQGMARLEP